MLVDAKLLLLLTSTDGLRAPTSAANGRTKRVAHLPRVDQQTLGWIWSKENPLSRGGMSSKLKSAQSVVEVGAAALIVDGRRPEHIGRACRGESVGTLIGSPAGLDRDARSSLANKRKHWIAFFQRPQGTLLIDDGAHRAIEHQGRSLLPIGIRAVSGNFSTGAMVQLKNGAGLIVARGLVEYDSQQIDRIKGHRTSEIKAILGDCPYDEVIHRDNMVILAGGREHPL
jgi:glutamate 5-kinase